MSSEIGLNATSSSLSAQLRSSTSTAPEGTDKTSDAGSVKKTAQVSDEKKSSSQETSQKADVSKDMMNNIRDQVQKLQDFMGVNNLSVNFSVDKESGNTVIRLKDAETQKVVRQIPSEDWLEMSRRIQAGLESKDKKALSGLLFDNQA